MKLSEYIKGRLLVVRHRIAAERIGGNDFKLHCELSAEAELRALECFLSSADYTKEPAAQTAPPTNTQSKQALREIVADMSYIIRVLYDHELQTCGDIAKNIRQQLLTL